MNGLQSIRSKAAVVTIGVLWLNVFLVLARVPFAAEASTAVLLLGAFAVAGSATGVWLIDRTGPATRLVSGASHAALVALLVYSFTGSHLQIDIHMYFFATLAILAVWVDWRPIVAFTAVTAVHHLVLNFALPAAVFPGDADLVRVAIHAAILLLEAGLLLAIVRTTHAALVESETALGESLAARQEAAVRAQEAEAVRGAQELDRRTAADARAHEAEATRAAVDQLGQALALLARGDLTVRIDQAFDGTLDGLRTNFNESVEGLRGSLAQVADSVGSIGDSAAEMRSASDNLLKRTEQQAASLEQTSAAFSEIAGAIRNASQHTQSARGLAEATAANTHRSRDVVVEAVAAMSRIEETSGKIGSITDLIDSIAFQTNLLALNAGVEAARAGDAGKGFAVVAQEVRALAQRAATAATDIKALIQQSGDEVQNGVRLVNSAGTALDEILGQVSSINETIASIATMAANEASGLQQVQVAIRQIDDVTQKNAAMVEENTAVTHRLAEDAASLRGLVGRFRLDQRQGAAAARRHAA